MIYICEDCGFLFRRFGKVKECPLCESERVRPATDGEGVELKEKLHEEPLG